MSKSYSVQGAGLGLRKSFLKQLDNISHKIDFLEIAPENWVEVGGRDAYIFRSLTEQFPFVCHGLSLNLGGMAPLDEEFLKCIKRESRKI